MKITCDLCQNTIDSTNIDLEKAIAKCAECNNVFDCSQQLKSTKNHRREDISLPRNIIIKKEKQELRIQFRWLSSQLVYLIPFCLCWDFAPFIWSKTGIIPTQDPLGMAYLILHILAAIGVTYYTLAKLINHTRVIVFNGTLKAVDSPLPFFKNKTIHVDELDQLYSKEKIHRGKKLSWPSYEVVTILKSGRVVRLVTGLNRSEQALYIEQTLEDYLGIMDRPVDGEISR